MNEYSHAMGNSLGNFADYWELIYSSDMIAGGFIWDWIDQAMYKRPSDAGSGFVYGGDFGDYPNDGNFCVNGIIGADLKPHPHYFEMQKVYQPVYFKLIQKQPLTIELTNHSLVTNTNEYQLAYQIIEDGKVTTEKTLSSFDLQPQKVRQLVLEDVTFNPKKETFITLKFQLKEDSKWADKSYVIAWEQFKISKEESENSEENIKDKGEIVLIKNSNNYTISGDKFEAVLDKSTGLLSGLTYNNKTIISDKTFFNFWRALTDNDEGWKVDQKLGVWKNEAKNFILKSLETKTEELGLVTIVSDFVFKETQTEGQVRHTFYADGKINIDVNMSIPEETSNVPRIGLQFTINEGLRNIKWYGRGPHENYFDRKTSAAVGIYNSTVTDWITPYVRPQENANRCDVRWINFGENRSGIQFSANAKNPLSVSAWPYSQEILESKRHDFELEKQNKIVVNIDHKQMGVGGDNSWGQTVMEKYQIKPGNYSYNFSIQPINK